MPRSSHHGTDLDMRAAHAGTVSVQVELPYLRAGVDPLWERPHRDGRDITDEPDLWTPYQRARRESFEARRAIPPRRPTVRPVIAGRQATRCIGHSDLPR